MEFPEEHGSRDPRPEPTPKHIMESAVSDAGLADDSVYADRVPPVPMHASDRVGGDVISLDAMRDNLRGAIVTNFEQDDLDVPAFLRKRNEVT
jgi:hypothetical protein